MEWHQVRAKPVQFVHDAVVTVPVNHIALVRFTCLNSDYVWAGVCNRREFLQYADMVTAAIEYLFKTEVVMPCCIIAGEPHPHGFASWSNGCMEWRNEFWENR